MKSQNKDIEFYKVSLQKFMETTQEVITAAKAFMSEAEKNETKENIRKQRSELMQRAANNRFYEKGVWKIGENHVQDIKKQHPYEKDGQNYNLVTREDFNIGLKQWNSSKKHRNAKRKLKLKLN